MALDDDQSNDAGCARRLLPDVSVVNVGVLDFAAALWAQGVPCAHVDWHPPDVDDETLILLEQLL